MPPPPTTSESKNISYPIWYQSNTKTIDTVRRMFGEISIRSRCTSVRFHVLPRDFLTNLQSLLTDLLQRFVLQTIQNYTTRWIGTPNGFIDNGKLIRDWRGRSIVHPIFKEIIVLDVEMIGKIRFPCPLVHILTE